MGFLCRSACEAFERECGAALHKLPTKATKQVEAPPESWPANQLPILEPGSFDSPQEETSLDTERTPTTRSQSVEATGVKASVSLRHVDAKGSMQAQDVPQPLRNPKKPETHGGFLITPAVKHDSRNKMRMSWARMLGAEEDSEEEESGKAADSGGDLSEKREESMAPTRAGGQMDGPDSSPHSKPSEAEGAARHEPVLEANTSITGTHSQDASKSPPDDVLSGNTHAGESGKGEEQPVASSAVEGVGTEERAAESRPDEAAASGALLEPVLSPSLPTFKQESEPSWEDEPQIKLARDIFGSGQILSPRHGKTPGENSALASPYSPKKVGAAFVPSLPAAGGSRLAEVQSAETSKVAQVDGETKTGGRSDESTNAESETASAAPVVSRLREETMAPLASVRASGPELEKSHVSESGSLAKPADQQTGAEATPAAGKELEQTEARASQTGSETPSGRLA